MVSLVIYIKVNDGTRRPVYSELVSLKRVSSIISSHKEGMATAYGGYRITKRK